MSGRNVNRHQTYSRISRKKYASSRIAHALLDVIVTSYSKFTKEEALYCLVFSPDSTRVSVSLIFWIGRRGKQFDQSDDKTSSVTNQMINHHQTFVVSQTGQLNAPSYTRGALLLHTCSACVVGKHAAY